MTGSILSVASEDGKVRLFKGEFDVEYWEMIAERFGYSDLCRGLAAVWHV